MVLEAIVFVGEGVQARSEKNNLGREDGQLALLALFNFGLGSGSRRERGKIVSHEMKDDVHSGFTPTFPGSQQCR